MPLPYSLVMAETETERKYRIRALRGYIRIARQFRLPVKERVDMCRKALELADRDDERKLVLQVLERHPNGDTLAMAVGAASIPSLKTDATNTALSIAQKVGGGSADIEKLLEQIGQGPIDLKIIKAEYGSRQHIQGCDGRRTPTRGPSSVDRVTICFLQHGIRW